MKRIVKLSRLPYLMDNPGGDAVYEQTLGYRTVQPKIATVVCTVYGKTQKECSERATWIMTFINSDFK